MTSHHTKVLLLISILLSSFLAQGQDIGLSVRYNYNTAQYWNAITRAYNQARPANSLNDLRHGYELGLDMGFALSHHLRLLPELNYRYLGSRSTTLERKQHYLGALVHLNIYPFGFGTQLHCPTFSQTPYGRSPQSGIFLQLSAGASLLMARNYQNGVLVEQPAGTAYQPNVLAASVGLGGGYDIILWERISVSPTLKLFLLPAVEVPDYDLATHGTTVLNLRDNHSAWLFKAGLRLGYIL